MPSSPTSYFPSAVSPSNRPWNLPQKSSPLTPTLQSYSHDVRYGAYITTPSPPSSPSRGSLTTSGATYSVPSSSYSPSAAPSSRGRSSSHEYGVTGLGISNGPQGVDALEYMSDRLSRAAENDRRMASKTHSTKASALHAKSLELAALQALANTRLARAKHTFADGIEAARECETDLRDLEGRVGRLNEKARRRWPQVWEDVDGSVGRVVDVEE